MEVRVDRGKCAASGLCVLTVPAVFDQSEEDGKVMLLATAPGPELAVAMRAAASRCPSGAITLVTRPEEEQSEAAGASGAE
ncbi:ferredoxin [Streptomyces sp. NPDC057654]|uniref:ferredoxin n=1 Tax=Streptomyces sp. NPDC057654 TaxID=3346196 RepID=UPI003685FCEE